MGWTETAPCSGTQVSGGRLSPVTNVSYWIGLQNPAPDGLSQDARFEALVPMVDNPHRGLLTMAESSAVFPAVRAITSLPGRRPAYHWMQMLPYGWPPLSQTTAAEASIRKSTGPVSPAARANTNGPPQSPVTLPHVMLGRGVSSPVWAKTSPFKILVDAAAQAMTWLRKSTRSPAKVTPSTQVKRSASETPISATVLTKESDGAVPSNLRKNPK